MDGLTGDHPFHVALSWVFLWLCVGFSVAGLTIMVREFVTNVRHRVTQGGRRSVMQKALQRSNSSYRLRTMVGHLEASARQRASFTPLADAHTKPTVVSAAEDGQGKQKPPTDDTVAGVASAHAHKDARHVAHTRHGHRHQRERQRARQKQKQRHTQRARVAREMEMQHVVNPLHVDDAAAAVAATASGTAKK